jgi:hypothetical protein
MGIMEYEPTADELALFDDISALAVALWGNSVGITGRNDDPKMFSIMLFKRLWSNHRGYAVLWNARLQTESDIILRSGIEGSICLVANYVLREDFVRLMLGDAIFTLKGQIKMYRDQGSVAMVQKSEAVLRSLLKRLGDDTKPARLDWKGLAEAGGVPRLYAQHRQLSGLSSHVTGASILTGVAPADRPNPAANLRPMQRKIHLMMMAGASLQGMWRHAEMIADEQGAEDAVALLSRLANLSWDWPGALERPKGDVPTTA